MKTWEERGRGEGGWERGGGQIYTFCCWPAKCLSQLYSDYKASVFGAAESCDSVCTAANSFPPFFFGEINSIQLVVSMSRMALVLGLVRTWHCHFCFGCSRSRDEGLIEGSRLRLS